MQGQQTSAQGRIVARSPTLMQLFGKFGHRKLSEYIDPEPSEAMQDPQQDFQTATGPRKTKLRPIPPLKTDTSLWL